MIVIEIKIGQDVRDRANNEPDNQYHDNKFYNIGFEQILEEFQRRLFISNASAVLDDEEVFFNGTTVKEKKFLEIF